MWNKLFGSSNTEGQKRQLFDLRKGAMVELDKITFSMLPEDALFPKLNCSQSVETRGYVDLGAATRLHRFYLSDNTWIQAKSVNGDDDASVDDLKLFVFYDTKTPTTQAGLDAIAGENSPLGRKIYLFEGKIFQRVWGDDEEQAGLVEFNEDVYVVNDKMREFTTTHRALLYERPLTGSERMEYLLISVEETVEDTCVVYSIGVDLTSADFSVI